jgi:hypothetical protein
MFGFEPSTIYTNFFIYQDVVSLSVAKAPEAYQTTTHRERDCRKRKGG